MANKLSVKSNIYGLKQSQIRRVENFARCTKNGFFFSAVKKDTIFGAAKKFFGPSYFLTALDEAK